MCSKLNNKIVKDEAGGICARYRDIESKYLELKKQIRRSKKNKMCYACSKFITSLTLQVSMPQPIPNKKYKGNNVLAKTTVNDGTSYIYSDLEGGKNDMKFEDVSQTVCDSRLFQSDKNSLDDAEGTCVCVHPYIYTPKR